MGALTVHVAEIARRRHPCHAVPPRSPPASPIWETSPKRWPAVPRTAAQIRRDDDAMDDLHRQLLAVVVDPELGARCGRCRRRELPRRSCRWPSLSGVLAPEDWANPEMFYAALARTGDAPLNEVVEAVVTPSTALTSLRTSAS